MGGVAAAAAVDGSPSTSITDTAFRREEKRYKQRLRPLDLARVIDLGQLAGDPRFKKVKTKTRDGRTTPAYRLVDPACTGLVILPSALGKEEQKELIRICLDECSTQNGSNLDTHYRIPQGGLWTQYKEAYYGEEETVVPRLADEREGDELDSAGMSASGPRKRVTHRPGDETLHSSTEDAFTFNDPPSQTVPLLPPSLLMHRMRWSNLGLFYHWPSKRYNLSKATVPVHEQIKKLALDLVGSIDWAGVYGVDDPPPWLSSPYNVEAGVINFYQPRDSLTAHQDISEADGTRPLLSISLGLDAIFLIGTESRDDPPLAFRLRSGDVVLLSGPVRRAFHALPRILEGTLPPYLSEYSEGPHPTWRPFGRFVASTRLNVNVRQVFNG